MRTESLCTYGLIKLIRPGPDLFKLGMNPELKGINSYPEFIEGVYGESGAIKNTRIICIDDNIEQRHDLAILYENGAKFSGDKVTQTYMKGISKNVDKIKKEYLILKL